MDMKELRQKAGLRAEEVAAHIGVAHSSIRNWEQGRTIPKLRVDQIGSLLKLYNCSFDDLEKAVNQSIDNYRKATAVL